VKPHQFVYSLLCLGVLAVFPASAVQAAPDPVIQRSGERNAQSPTSNQQLTISSIFTSPLISRIRDLKPPTTLKEWESQLETHRLKLITQNSPIPITGVKLNQVDAGLEIVLETQEGRSLQIDATKFRTENNSLIADIPNAVLALPDAQAFNADNPTGEIATVRVTQLDASTVQVTVTGKDALPTQEITLETGNLSYSLNPEGEAPEEEIVVKGEGQQRGYFVPDATTATRTDTPLRDIPQSIQVVPRQVIEDQKILRISDAVRNVSGVTPQGGYAGLTDNYNIRGFTTYDNLRDGYYAQDNLINPANIERIEVLKGPASVLYGQFEPGGVVNYVTKKPLSEPYYFAEFTVGSFNTYRPSIDLSGPLNPDKTLLYRLNAAYENSGSFIDFVDQEQFSIAPSLTYKIGDATTLTLQYEYQKADRTYYDGLPPDPVVFKAPISRFLGEPGDRYEIQTHTIFLTLNHRFNENLRLRSAFTTALYDTEESEIRPNSIASDGRTVLRRYAAGPGYYRNYALQTDLIGNFNTGSVPHQVLVGLEWNKYRYGYDYLRSSVDLTPSIDLFNPVYGASPPAEFDEASQRDRFERSTIGLYAQDQVTLLSNLKLLVGGRYDFIHRKNSSQPLDVTGRDPTDDASVDRLYNGAFSPRVGIVYQPIPPISLYASYSRSFNPSGSRTVDGSLLPPERGTQYEAGIRAETLNGRLSATLSAYEIIKSNVATLDPNNTDFSIAAGEVKSRGIEFDVAGEILPGWNIIASAFINDAFVSQDNSLPVGNRLVNAPRQGASLWTTYEIQRGSLKGLGFGAGIFFVGDREAELPNTFEIPSYVRADAAIYYKRDRWKVGLNFKNLTSTRYYESQGYYLRPGAPFSVLGTISVNF
jgi:iron complex outermembrane receptor protein